MGQTLMQRPQPVQLSRNRSTLPAPGGTAAGAVLVPFAAGWEERVPVGISGSAAEANEQAPQARKERLVLLGRRQEAGRFSFALLRRGKGE